MRVLFTAIALLGLALVGGCGTMVQSNVSVFHELPAAAPAGEVKVFLSPARDAMANSLEYQSYARAIGEEFAKRGYAVVDKVGESNMLALIDYGIDDGRDVVSSRAVPQYGVTGYNSFTSGTVTNYGGMSSINATTTRTPTYGLTGYRQVVDTDTVYKRFLNLDIFKPGVDGQQPKRVYEGRLRSEGSCGTLVSVMPVFIQAIFTEFPGQSGTARNVNLPLPKGTKC